MLGRKRKAEQASEPAWATVVQFAKHLYFKTQDARFDQFSDMVLAAVADTDKLDGKVAPTPDAVAVAQRDPTANEEVAARVVALVAAFAESELETEAAGELVMYAAMAAARFDDYQTAAGR